MICQFPAVDQFQGLLGKELFETFVQKVVPTSLAAFPTKSGIVLRKARHPNVRQNQFRAVRAF